MSTSESESLRRFLLISGGVIAAVFILEFPALLKVHYSEGKTTGEIGFKSHRHLGRDALTCAA
jgi:hypothetical protein